MRDDLVEGNPFPDRRRRELQRGVRRDDVT